MTPTFELKKLKNSDPSQRYAGIVKMGRIKIQVPAKTPNGAIEAAAALVAFDQSKR